jgi:hypothetical protein
MKREAARIDPWLSETVSLVELSRRWHMSRKEVRQLLGHGRLQFVEIAGSLRVPRDAVEGYERSQQATP